MKPWYASKTLWLNFALVILTVVEMHFDLLRSSLGDKSYLAGMAGIAGINFLLRFATTQPVGGNSK